MTDTTDLLNHAFEKNPVDFGDTFNQLMQAKAQAAVEAHRVSLAQSIYGDASPEEEDDGIDEIDIDEIDDEIDDEVEDEDEDADDDVGDDEFDFDEDELEDFDDGEELDLDLDDLDLDDLDLDTDEDFTDDEEDA